MIQMFLRRQPRRISVLYEQKNYMKGVGQNEDTEFFGKFEKSPLNRPMIDGPCMSKMACHESLISEMLHIIF